MDGLLLIDKSAGMTSHDVVDGIRRRFKIQAVGHAGTLDPQATGLLILLIGRATRSAPHFLKADKSYRATLRLGISTDTQDGEGRVVERRPVDGLTPLQIEAASRRFVGNIEQEVPAYSAVKIRGKRFYQLARAGQSVPRRTRRIVIHELKVLDMPLPDVELEVTCSSGTYVRTLCADLGSALGCGGHLAKLRRTRIGDFTIDQAVPLKGCAPEQMIPLDRLSAAPQTAL